MLHPFLYLAFDGIEIQIQIHVFNHSDSINNNYGLLFLLAWHRLQDWITLVSVQLHDSALHVIWTKAVERSSIYSIRSIWRVSLSPSVINLSFCKRFAWYAFFGHTSGFQADIDDNFRFLNWLRGGDKLVQYLHHNLHAMQNIPPGDFMAHYLLALRLPDYLQIYWEQPI